tara:strand:- start:18 stop:200 length:183 start_codon:yes stop_codon:yes gene_type:complete
MWVDPEDDPRLDNVREILSALIIECDRLEWEGKFVNPNIVSRIRRMRNLVSEGILWEPKF